MLKILTGRTNPILRKKSEEVKNIDKKIIKFIGKMIKTLNDEDNGIGLASPQVGENIRLIIVKLLKKDKKNYSTLEMINPEITFFSKEKEIDIEGCLSVPNEFGKVERSKIIKVSFFNKKNEQLSLELKGINARLIQHEVDHLDGILFTDKVIEFVKVEDEKAVKV